MIDWLRDSWNTLMDTRKNPLKNIPDADTRHMTLQILAWMWMVIFASCVGSFTVFGLFTLISITIVHSLMIAGIAITLSVFQISKRYCQPKLRHS